MDYPGRQVTRPASLAGRARERKALPMHRSIPSRALALALLVTIGGCGRSKPPVPAAGAGNAAFDQLAAEVLEDGYRRNPTTATYLGVHKYDDQLEDASQAAIAAEAQALHAFRDRVAAVDTAALTLDRQLDREQLLGALDSQLLASEGIRTWARDPDRYSSSLTRTAFIMIKRSFAAPEERMRLLTARQAKMPAILAAARANLDNPPQIYTQIAIDQMDGNIDFFKTVVPAGFEAVRDTALRGPFQRSNQAVIDALAGYKKWLQADLLPRSKGDFAIGADAYLKKLAADEMLQVPLDQLLEIAQADLKRNQEAFLAVARQIDANKPATEVLAALQTDHPPADQLLATTQGTLDALRQFISDKKIVTIPESAPARVEETPPFLRATTSASMDTPGPFETRAPEAFYNMTLPEPKWRAAEKAEFMKQWYYAAISNVSVHEVYPGHYLQFLYAKTFPSDVRKVYGAATNSEGWAHYAEQMVLDEGFHAEDPRYRLAQLQDALLRDVRFIVGIKMHTQGMTVAEAQHLFETDGYQPAPVALSEAKRGTGDPTYGYYTMGKLMILKLRDDYKAKVGAAYSMQQFHDAFIALGPLPLPLIRKAMLGETGQLF